MAKHVKLNDRKEEEVRCPACGSPSIEALPGDRFGVAGLVRDMTCKKCQHEWELTIAL